MTQPKLTLKQVSSRPLRGGEWVVVAPRAEPLVLNAATKDALESYPATGDELPAEFTNALAEAGYVTGVESDTHGEMVPYPPSKSLRFFVWFVGLLALAASLWLLSQTGIPWGSAFIQEQPIMLVGAVSIAIALLSAVPHELAHIWLGRANLSGVRLAQAVATTDLSHTWVWPAGARFLAVCGGFIVDLILFSTFLAIYLWLELWWAWVGSATLLMRILWQFRFHRNCDGRILATFAFDQPAIAELVREKELDKRLATVWISLVVLGFAVDLLLVLGWLGPPVVELLGRVI